MPMIETKLLECFQAVFPSMPEAKLRAAVMADLAQWDSLATITLATVVQETFALEIEPEDLPQLTSFQSIAEYLRRRTAT